MTILTDILKSTEIYTPENTDIGYHKSHINVLLQQLKKRTNIEQSKIWDYIAVENDPFFSRRYPSNNNKLSKILSTLSLSQQALTSILAQLHLANVYNFIPKNFLNIVRTYTRLIDAGNNVLPTIQQQIPFNMIEQALLHDLLSYFNVSQTTYNDIIDLSNTILANMDLYSNIETGDLKSILSLPLRKFLPQEFSVILDSLAYLDLLDQIFTDDTEKNNFNNAILNVFEQHNNDPVNTYIDSSYETYNITYSDPLGITRQESMISDLSSNLFDNIHTDLNVIYDQYNISVNHQTQITQALSDSFQSSILDQILDSGVLLPDLTDCSNTIKTQSHNDTVNAIKNSFILFQTEILKQIPELKSNDESFDYLINIKNNLEIRQNYINRGSTIDNIYEIQSYINGVLNNKMTDVQIDQLYDKIKGILKI